MKRTTLIATTALLSFGLALGTALASTGNDEAVVMQLSSKMEQFYGKSVSEVDNFLTSEYGTAVPVNTAENENIILVPVNSPFCGSLSLETQESKVVNWQTMAWKRTEKNMYGEACDLAFQRVQ